MKILLNHAELTLKGRNRPFFENRLKENIRHVLGDVKIANLYGRFLVEASGDMSEKINRLSSVSGIANFSIINEVVGPIETLEKKLIHKLASMPSYTSFAVRTKRVDKHSPISSQEMNMRIGELIGSKLNKKVDLTNPDLTIFIEIQANAFWYYFTKYQGPHGLPVGTSGKVLSLLSGGIDSPVASYLMARRGCYLDFLHFHAFSDNKYAEKSKISNTARKLNEYTLYSTLTYAAYTPFQMSLLELKTEYELIIFRRFMLRVGEEMAKRYGYQALVTGDNLGQVASQTIENLYATQQAVALPVLRPLIGFNKNEIVDAARSIGTYDLSIKPYKDCCSIVESHPKTKVILEKMLNDEQKLPIKQLVEETLAQSSLLRI